MKTIILSIILVILVVSCAAEGELSSSTCPQAAGTEETTPPDEDVAQERHAVYMQTMYEVPTGLAVQNLDFEPDLIRFVLTCWDVNATQTQYVMQGQNNWDSGQPIQYAGAQSDFGGAIAKFDICMTEITALSFSGKLESPLYGGVTTITLLNHDNVEIVSKSNICRYHPADKVDEANFYVKWGETPGINPVCNEE